MRKKDDVQEILDAIDALGEVTLPVSSFADSIVDPYDEEDDREMNIISALDRVVTRSRKSGLRKTFWNKLTKEFAFLCHELDMTPKEVLIIGVLSEVGKVMTWENLGNFLGLSRLKAMSLKEEIKILRNKKWVRYHINQGLGENMVGFRLSAGVVSTLQNNRKFIPEKLDGLSEQAFVDRLSIFFKKDGANRHIPLEDKVEWFNELCEVNKQLPLCETYFSLNEESSRKLLLLAINDYTIYTGTPSEGLIESDIEDWFEEEFELDVVKNELTEGKQELFRLGLLEFGTDDGLADKNRWKLTLKAREDLLGAYQPRIRRQDLLRMRSDRNLRSHVDILEKELFYNPTEREQVDRISRLLSKDGLDNVKTRLSESGLRCGICCLLYGAPGTGKTETVLQLAKRTGRDIFQVNISGLRDKFVGESEKNIKMVFERYKKLCQGSEHIPILLFNEADAIFGRRFENLRSSVEKMDNAIQNIILQEMETFEGILIATTNLTDNLDSAFDRRFLFKVEFTNPSVEARTKIWHSLLPEIDKEECATFAKEFNLSGGQIENVARKYKIEYVATGVYPDKDKVKSFCKEEYLNRRNTHRRVGF
ncbi:MAG: ATP-binding protein [Muribaculaceae bacterium]|nr:ATP-binding protein [Muribaculaceae bacterium]